MVSLLHWSKLESSELNVARIVEFMGGKVEFLNLSAGNSTSGGLQPVQIQPGACVVAHADTLVQMVARHGPGDRWLRELTSRAANCLVYGFSPGAEHDRLLSQLTSGGLSGVEDLPADSTEFSVNADAQEVCGQFAGLTFGQGEPDYDSVFVEGANFTTSCTPLICAGKRPFFVSTKRQNCEMFLLACRQAADLDEPIAGPAIVPFFSRLAPVQMFLYRAGGDRYWRNDALRACLILDDPLLQNRYGFLDYEKLLELMEQEDFSTSIAFIPWNYRRSNPRTARLFARFPYRYALCVHGCDHTGGEFAASDVAHLRELAQQGLERMRLHAQLTGIGFDNVMVFPQGRFSTAAMEALKSCGYLAAVNSTPCPVDLKGVALQLRDLVEGAVTRFSGFPLFVRRYPNDLAGLAYDLFLGKPALLVEHHGIFRTGYELLTKTVQTLNRIGNRLEWGRLSTICSQACMKRRADNGDIHIRFYTDRFDLRNTTGKSQSYRLSQRQALPPRLSTVTIDGVQAETEIDKDELRFSLELNPGRTAQILVRRPHLPVPPAHFRLRPMRHAAVFVRRRLSEFRDNHVDRNLFLSRLATRVRNRFVGKIKHNGT